MIRRSTRRTFLMQTALAGAGSFLRGGAPAHARTLRDSPNERVRFACIGVGGKATATPKPQANTARSSRSVRSTRRCSSRWA